MTDTLERTNRPRTIFAAELRATSLGLLTLIALIAFEAMAVSAALPTAAREVNGLAAFGWTFTGFLIANIVGMVAAGQISDVRGPRLPIMVGLVAFTAGLVVAGTAAQMWQLVGGRLVQGLGGGLLITAVYVVIGEMYPDELRPKLFAAVSSAWVLPSLVGPSVAGLLTEHATWRLVFLGLLPFVAAGAAMLVPALRTLRPRAGGRVSYRRIGCAVAVSAGVAALAGAGHDPSAASLVAAVAGLALLAWGLRPLLPAGTLLVRPGVSAPVALRGLLAGAFFGIESMVPLSLSVQHGFGPTEAALPLTLSGLTWALGSWWQSRDGIGDDRVTLIRRGFGFLALSAAGAAIAVQQWASGWFMYPAWAVAGIGAGLAMSSLGILLLRFTTDADRGSDSAALQLSDALVSAITTAFAGVLVAFAARGVIGYTAAFAAVNLAMLLVAAAGVALASRARPAEK